MRTDATRRLSRYLRLALCLIATAAFATAPAQPPAAPALPPGLFEALPARCIGPANMSGRVTAVAVVESNPDRMYVATASGGLWVTADGGKSWKASFHDQNTVCIGDVAVAPSNPDLVWLGTGENNPRNSVAWGDGVYKSADGGKSWQHMGLKETQHIGRIVIHPTNPDIVYVAALGRVWGKNPERGLYKTTDGGKSWQLSKFLDDETGFIDVAMHPGDPATLYAAAWRVRRDAFSGGNPAIQTGANAGLFRTTDGGKTWEKMAGGLPNRAYGRSGLAVSRKDPKVVYAVVQTDKTEATVKGQLPNVARRTVTDASGKKSVEDVGPAHGGIFRSDDAGKTWKHINSLCPRPFYYGQIRIDPNDTNGIYVLGIPFYVSADGGRTFKTAPMKGVHVDHHALWVNPKDSKHLVLGNDGGLYVSKDRGTSWKHLRGMALGQFYGVAVDMRKPYRVYGGLQDNGSWGGPSATRRADGILIADWFRIYTGDGFQCAADPTNLDIVYAESQYGRPARVNTKSKQTKQIQPKAAKGEPAYRFNWNSPLFVSPHNPTTVYFAGNHVFRSEDRGDNWKAISDDLTRGQPGASKSTGHTVSALAESPLKAGLLYAGTDDGNLWVTKDGGKKWTDLTKNIPNIPDDRWIAKIEPSHHDEGTAYLAIDRHRNDDRKPYLFRTTDHGATWKPIMANLPDGDTVYVVRESSRNRDLLFVGTEFGLYVSTDRATQWHRVKGGLPTVAVHDLVIHPRDRELVIATHGRSVWVMDVGPLEAMTAKTLAADAQLFDVRPAVAFRPRKDAPPADLASFVGENPPYGALIYFHLREAPQQPPTLTIANRNGEPVATLTGSARAGLQRIVWNLSANGALAAPGEYTARLRVGERMLTKTVRVEAE